MGVDTHRAESIPTHIGEGRVVLYSRLDERHEPTGAGWQLLHGEGLLAPAWCIAICESADGGGFLLFSCGEDWTPITASHFATL